MVNRFAHFEKSEAAAARSALRRRRAADFKEQSRAS
jgi:hypothetical protein